MPWPVSPKEIWIIPRSTSKRVETVSRPVPPMASAALMIRFMNTCCICAGSTTASGMQSVKSRITSMLWKIARSSTSEKHSSMTAQRFAGLLCGFLGREKSSSARMIVAQRAAWLAIFSTEPRLGSSAAMRSSSRCE